MTDIIKTVSQLIESQFPAIYREEGPQLIAFTKAYFQFLEEDEDSSHKLSRQLFDINDIDKTLDEFLVNYKEKYLKDFPFAATTDKRFMIKHIMDYYRSKGSTQSLELLMKMLYGEEIEVYYPSQDVLKPSESKWISPKYIEVSKSRRTSDFIDQQIRGSISGATAFVESIVTKRSEGKLIDVVYLSDVRGVFTKEETVSNDGVDKDAPVVQGSLSNIDIYQGGRDNKVGDIFGVEAYGGVQGKVRITEVADATGRVDFTLEHGGSGYTARRSDGTNQTDIYISDTVLDIDNPDLDYIRFEKIEQPLETLYLLSSSDISEQAKVHDYVTGYSADGSYVANGIIVQVQDTYANNDIILEARQIVGLDSAANTFIRGERVVGSFQGAGQILDFNGVNMDIQLDSSIRRIINGEEITGRISGATAIVESSVPGTMLKVLTTDQSFANQCIMTLTPNADFIDGEVIEEEGIVKISLENETSSFVVDDYITQYITANSVVSAPEEFMGNGSQTTFTHSLDLEAENSRTVVSVDNVTKVINRDYQLDGNDVIFNANSIPEASGVSNVFISRKTDVERVIDSSTGIVTANGELVLYQNLASIFRVNDVIIDETHGTRATVRKIDEDTIFYKDATGTFSSNSSIVAERNGSLFDEANGAITKSTLIISPSWGEWYNGAAIEQGSVSANITSDGVYVDVTNTEWVGAKGIVQKDDTIDANDVVIMNLSGTFNTGKMVRGETSKTVSTIANIAPTGVRSVYLNGDMTVNGNVDDTVNSYAIGTLVGQNTTSIGIKYDEDAFGNKGNTFEGNLDGMIFINTRRDLMVSPPRFTISDPTHNIYTTKEFSQNEVIETLTDEEIQRSAMFEAYVQFPQPLEPGTIWEMGDDVVGASFALLDEGQGKVLRLRAGVGAGTTTGEYVAIIDIPEADIPTDLNWYLFVWHLDPKTGTINLWFDGVEKGPVVATNGLLGGPEGQSGYLGLGPRWADPYAGKFGGVTNLVVGENVGDWKGRLLSTLKYFDNVSANTTSLAGTIMELDGEIVYNASFGEDASFDIETISNADTYLLNTDIIGSNNISGVPYLDVNIDGSGSGIGFIDNIVIVASGTGYSPNDPVIFTGGNPSKSAAGLITGVDINGAITQVGMTERGEGYLSTPTITIQSQNGTGGILQAATDFGYGFPKDPGAAGDMRIIDVLNWEEFEVGIIEDLGAINPGTGYTRDPFVVVYNPFIASYNRGDYILTLFDITGSFEVGELISQPVNGNEFFKGRVISWDRDGRVLEIERTSFEVGFDFSAPVIGKNSNGSGMIESIASLNNQNVMGDNAVVSANVIFGGGIATAAEVIDSGYGYITGEKVTLSSTNGNSPYIITGSAFAETQGIGEGFWASTDSHLNSEKKIHDNKYYQEFSYDVLSGLSLDRYENLLKRVLHVSGTELFGTVVKRSNIPLEITAPSSNSSITIE